MTEIISQETLDLLPLAPEPIATWTNKSDLRVFLKKMYEFGGYSSYGEYLFDEGLKRWEKTRLDFEENANKAMQWLDENEKQPIPDFRNDLTFGKVAKYNSLRRCNRRGIVRKRVLLTSSRP